MSEWGRKLEKYEMAIWNCAEGTLSNEEKEKMRDAVVEAHINEVIKDTDALTTRLTRLQDAVEKVMWSRKSWKRLYNMDTKTEKELDQQHLHWNRTLDHLEALAEALHDSRGIE